MHFFSATFTRLDILLFKFKLWSQRKANFADRLIWAARLTIHSVIKRKQLIKTLNNWFRTVLWHRWQYDTRVPGFIDYHCGTRILLWKMLSARWWVIFINILNRSNGVSQCLLIGAERNRELHATLYRLSDRTWIVYICKPSLSFSLTPVIIFSARGENCSEKYIWN